MRRKAAFLLAWLAAPIPALAAEPHIEPVAAPPSVVAKFRSVPPLIGGRVKIAPVTATATPYPVTYVFQWPGVYFEAGFKGPDVYFKVASSRDRLKISVDGKSIGILKKPAPGQYHVGDLGDGPHRIRLEKLSESQEAASIFGGFAIPPSETPMTTAPRPRQIEFIGDSLTLGFGATSDKVDCSPDDIWATTDTAQAFGPLTAKALKADYRVNAVSGHGLVRNYDGVLPGSTVPALYPFALFDQSQAADDAGWQPQVVVIGLGTNDFATPVHAGEAWRDDDALKTAYETAYVAFVTALRTKYPQALFVLVSYDGAMVQTEVAHVVHALKLSGETRVAPLAMSGFHATGCAGHLTVADHKKAAQALSDLINAEPALWPAP